MATKKSATSKKQKTPKITDESGYVSKEARKIFDEYMKQKAKKK